MINKLLQIAMAEVGYLEKASNSQLDDKTANAGSGNYTKYARDLDNLKDFYNYPKNGYAWCDVFVDWCFVQAFGREQAQALLGQPNYSAGAGCYYSAQYYQAIGAYYTSNPQPGDQVFFRGFDHTGLVYKVKNNIVYTIEGNTSSGSGVIPNGGAVCCKAYGVNDGSIEGYGRARMTNDGEIIELHPELKRGDKGTEVHDMQVLLINNGYNLPQYGADYDFGGETEEVLKKFQADKGLVVNGIADKKTWDKLEGKEEPIPTPEPEPEPEEQSLLMKILYAIFEFLKKFFEKKPDPDPEPVPTPTPTPEEKTGYDVQVSTPSGVNVRSGPGSNYGVVGVLPNGAVKTIIEESENWGKLSDMDGWICLDYTVKI